ncbi:hypothetical protein HS1genome_0020 [Sulfodiicoccus acidiphilus]|uniref:Uncharacterized protein n=1 Tax=Sulfodiicoccus acidiphilus TaxID=1670455 RepID=A0A348B0C9_9CREN|nr:hypothetical protein HS1genome_0020 [Sulfodiicoccus acidiphilus]
MEFSERKLFRRTEAHSGPKIFGSGTSLVQGEGFLGPEAPVLELMDARLCECRTEVLLKYQNKNPIL